MGIFFNWQLNKTSLLNLAYTSFFLLQFNYWASFIKWVVCSIFQANATILNQVAPCWLLTLSTCDNSLEKETYPEKLCKVSDLRHWPTSDFKLSNFSFPCSINIIDYYSCFNFYPSQSVHHQVFFPKLTLFVWKYLG